MKSRRSAVVAVGVLTALLIGISGEAAEPVSAPLDFSRALSTAGTMSRLHSVLVSHRGELVLERYFNGRSREDLANVKSVSKSIVSALVGIAISRGDIPSVEQPIGKYFSDRLSAADTARGQITIENLLTMQAGLETTSNRNYGAWVLSDDWLAFALRQPRLAPPGELMEYSTGNTHLLSAILTQATGLDTLSFARKALAEPLGFELAPWPKDPHGIYFGGNDMELTPRQMLAFGELYLNGGVAGGKQVVPVEWVRASLQPRAVSLREEGRFYGYGWWIREMAGYETPYAWGFGGQLIVLVPRLELVVVTTSSTNPSADRRSHTRRMYDFVEFDVIEPISSQL